MKRLNIIKFINLTFIFLASLLLFSCVSTQNLIIDIPLPSTNELPSSIQSMTIVSRTTNNSYSDLSGDSLQKIFYNKKFNVDTVIYDYQMADTTIKVLGNLLFDSGRYDYVIPENRHLRSPGSSLVTPEMGWDEAQYLTNTFKTDAVLSLDYLKTRIITNYKIKLIFDPLSGGFITAPTATMKILYDALFRVYYPKEKKIILREFVNDTLYWEDSNTTANDLFSRFTPVKDALSEAGIAIALDLSEKIAVRWRSERRKLFVKGNKNFKKANVYATQGDWKSAISIWEKIVNKSSSKSIKSKAYLNIALGYEMLGDIDLAIKMALKSYNTMYRPLTYEYLNLLKYRKKEINNTK